MPTILTEEQAKTRLNSSRNLVSRFGNGSPASSDTEVEPSPEVVITPYADYGRKTGISHPFSEDEKIAIAVRRGNGEKLQSIADSYNTNPATIRAIETGRTKVNRKRVDELIGEVQDEALLKLMMSLDLISPEKLSKLSAKDLGNFASSMSKVIGNTRDKDESEARVHVHLYAPEMRSEISYKTVEIIGA